MESPLSIKFRPPRQSALTHIRNSVWAHTYVCNRSSDVSLEIHVAVNQAFCWTMDSKRDFRYLRRLRDLFFKFDQHIRTRHRHQHQLRLCLRVRSSKSRSIGLGCSQTACVSLLAFEKYFNKSSVLPWSRALAGARNL